MTMTIPAPVRPAPRPVPAVKAGPVGPGAGVLMTEYHLPSVLGNDPQRRMAKALRIGMEVDWVRAAERVIASKIASCDWHLEDPDDEEIDDEWQGDHLALIARDLIADPQGALAIDEAGRRMSRRGFLRITSRHMGIAGNSGWLLDMVDKLGLPHALLYVRPDRLTEVTTTSGTLTGWLLDKRPGFPGSPIGVDELRLLQFEPPDVGIFGPGLIESSMAKALNNGLIDSHYTALLRSGGRLSGIIAPKEGTIDDDAIYQQLVRDWRNITEQPEAARRLQVVRAPVEFTSTVMGIGEMQIIDLMYHNRDALLALWGAPLSQLGGTAASGLNSGETRKYDEATLWQAAVHDRLTEIRETFQSILDLWEPVMGWAPKLCFEEPEFDDETPAYDRAQKVEGQPLRNWERRQILGLDPFGDPALDNEIWMPVQVVSMAMAPDEDGRIPTPTVGMRVVDNPKAVPQEPGTNATETPAMAPEQAPAAVKAALDRSARRLRDTMDERITPRLRDAVGAALTRQRDTIAAAIEQHWQAITAHGGRDTSQWWREGDLPKALRAAVAGMAEQVAGHLSTMFAPGKATITEDSVSARAMERALRRLGGRISGIDETTREGVRAIITGAIDEGLSARDAAQRVREWSGWDEARAERIARTELMNAYNSAALDTYDAYGVREVVADDGDKDEQCADRHGRVYSVADAEGIADHPNGTLDWLPVAAGISADQVRSELHAVRPIRGM